MVRGKSGPFNFLLDGLLADNGLVIVSLRCLSASYKIFLLKDIVRNDVCKAVKTNSFTNY